MATNNALQLFNSTITNPRTQDYLKQVLGKRASAFVTSLTSIVGNNANLQQCQPMSLIYAATKAAALDLPVDSNLGFAYIIPYKNNKTGVTDAQFQLGYKGLVQLAIRSGQFQIINVTDVREGEYKGNDLLTGEMRLEQVENRISLPIVGYVAFFRLTNGFSKSLYMSREEMEHHATRYSQTYASKTAWVKQSSKWTTDFDAMAKKTVLKLLLNRYAPLSVEMQSAVQADQGVFNETGAMDYADNDPNAAKNTIAAMAEEAVAEEVVDTETGEIKTEE